MAIAVATQSKTILLAGDPVRVEATAAAILSPGECVKRDSSGDYVVSAAGDNLQNIALEQDFKGSETANYAIDIDYASGDRVMAAAPRKGDRYQLRLDATGATTVAIGEEVAVGAGGAVLGGATALTAIGTAVTGGVGGTDDFIIVEVL